MRFLIVFKRTEVTETRGQTRCEWFGSCGSAAGQFDEASDFNSELFSIRPQQL